MGKKWWNLYSGENVMEKKAWGNGNGNGNGNGESDVGGPEQRASRTSRQFAFNLAFALTCLLISLCVIFFLLYCVINRI